MSCNRIQIVLPEKRTLTYLRVAQSFVFAYLPSIAGYISSARNKASGLTGHLVAIFLIQGLLVHLCPDK